MDKLGYTFFISGCIIGLGMIGMFVWVLSLAFN